MTASYDAWGLSAVAADAKEALVKAGDAAFNEEEAKSMPYALYEVSGDEERGSGKEGAARKEDAWYAGPAANTSARTTPPTTPSHNTAIATPSTPMHHHQRRH